MLCLSLDRFLPSHASDSRARVCTVLLMIPVLSSWLRVVPECHPCPACSPAGVSRVVLETQHLTQLSALLCTPAPLMDQHHQHRRRGRDPECPQQLSTRGPSPPLSPSAQLRLQRPRPPGVTPTASQPCSLLADLPAASPIPAPRGTQVCVHLGAPVARRAWWSDSSAFVVIPESPASRLPPSSASSPREHPFLSPLSPLSLLLPEAFPGPPPGPRCQPSVS